MENINTAKKEYNEIYTSPMKNLSYTIFLPISNIQPSVNFVRYRLSNHEKKLSGNQSHTENKTNFFTGTNRSRILSTQK